MVPEGNSMCRYGCGFYGNPATDGLCSLCYKEMLRRKQEPSSTSSATSTISTVSATLQELPSTSSATSTISALSATLQEPSSTSSATSTISTVSATLQQLPSTSSANSTISALSATLQELPSTSSATSTISALSATLLETHITEPTNPVIGAASTHAHSIGNNKDTKEKAAGTSSVVDDKLDLSKEQDNSSDKDSKKKNRCAMCRKKVGLIAIKCRCGGLYCGIHRYLDKHDCSFDYRDLGAQEIRRNNPVVTNTYVLV